MELVMQIALVALGSAIGGLTRWGVAVGVGRLLGTGFPFGTLIINLTGSFFIGWFLTVIDLRMHAGSAWLQVNHLRLLVAVGFTGAYTTFSTFEHESYKLFRDEQSILAAAYIAISVFIGLLAVHLGVLVAKWQCGEAD